MRYPVVLLVLVLSAVFPAAASAHHVSEHGSDANCTTAHVAFVGFNSYDKSHGVNVRVLIDGHEYLRENFTWSGSDYTRTISYAKPQDAASHTVKVEAWWRTGSGSFTRTISNCTPPTPPPAPPVTNVCPCPPPCPPTVTTVTVVDHVTVTDHGLAPAPPNAKPCKQRRKLVFYSPSGKLGRVLVAVDGKRVRTANLHFRKSALKIKRLNLAGAGKARLTIKAYVRKHGKLVVFRWSGDVRRCGGDLAIDP